LLLRAGEAIAGPESSAAKVDQMIRTLLREPVLHFLLIGVAIFVAYGLVTPRERVGNRIVVSSAIVDSMVRDHETRWRRPPTEQELSGLVESFVRDEILYREGVALGLERDDPVIKRRVRQKLEVIAEEQQARDAPTGAELAAYFAQHADRFTRPGAVSFEQIPFRESASPREIEALRTAAGRGADPATLGPPSLLPARVKDLRLDLVARDFGPPFAASIAGLPLNEWSGPVRSGYGQHLVRVTARTAAVVPPLDEVRAVLAREWENERRAASLAESYRKLRSQYEVVIEAGQVSPVAAR
jgi:hypothetical protein